MHVRLLGVAIGCGHTVSVAHTPRCEVCRRGGRTARWRWSQGRGSSEIDELEPPLRTATDWPGRLDPHAARDAHDGLVSHPVGLSLEGKRLARGPRFHVVVHRAMHYGSRTGATLQRVGPVIVGCPTSVRRCLVACMDRGVGGSRDARGWVHCVENVVTCAVCDQHAHYI